MSGVLKIVDLEGGEITVNNIDGVGHINIPLPSLVIDDTITIEEETFDIPFLDGWNIIALPCRIEDVTKIEYFVNDVLISTDTNIPKSDVYIYTKKGYPTEVSNSQQNRPEYIEEVHDSFAISKLFQLPTADNRILIAKDNTGSAYLPEFNFDGVGNMSKYESFQVKTNSSFTLKLTSKREHIIEQITVNGVTNSFVQFGGYVKMCQGWNFIRFPLKFSQGLDFILANVIDKLVIVKNNAGSVYLPEYNFNNIGDVIPNEGYQIKVKNGFEITLLVTEDFTNSLE